MPRKFLRNVHNGNLIDFNTVLADYDRYEAYFEPLPGEPPCDPATGEPVTGEPATTEGTGSAQQQSSQSQDADRAAKILEAVKNIEPENYGRPAGGRPALPKKAAVETLTGFKVTVDEIHEAVKALGPKGE